MVKIRLTVCFMLLVPVACAQGTPGAAGDIYAGFVGEWAGTSQYPEKGNLVAEPVELQISERKGYNGLVIRYTTGDGTVKPKEHTKRLLTLDVAHQRMTSKWDGAAEDEWQASRLDEFQKSGLGAFSVSKRSVDNGQVTIFLGEFRLSATEFTYVWQRSENGKPFELFGYFKLHRVATP